MEEPKPGDFGQSREIRPLLLRSNLSSLSLLLALATLIRIWHLCHTEVTSRDSIGFERYAWELQHKTWPQTLRENAHHPLYPLTLLGMSWPVRWLHPDSDLAVMQLSAQLASGLAGIILVVPMFYLGRELFNRRVGFWSAALFQCLPAGARVMSDALSEPLFLVLIVTGLLMAVRALGSRSLVHFALCGLFTGLAYLTRPEGILLGVSAGLVLLGLQATRAFTGTWQRALIWLACLTAPALMVGGPYIAIIGSLSNKTTTKEILQTAQAEAIPQEREIRPSVPLFASLVALWWPDGREADFRGHLGWSVYALTSEIVKGYFYVAWLPALLGIAWHLTAPLAVWQRPASRPPSVSPPSLGGRYRGGFRDCWHLVPGAWVLLVLCLLQGVALLRVALMAGYLSDRHVLIIVLCGLYWAVATVFLLAHLWAKGNGLQAAGMATVLFLVLAAFALPKTLAPLHPNRAGHHAVGLWLAEHASPADEIIDPFCWAAHYAGRTFQTSDAPPPAIGICRHRFIVHECRPDHRDRYRPPSIPEAEILAAGGNTVYHWPTQGSLDDAKIVLYDIPLHQDK
jgi:hypothetical protein